MLMPVITGFWDGLNAMRNIDYIREVNNSLAVKSIWTRKEWWITTICHNEECEDQAINWAVKINDLGRRDNVQRIDKTREWLDGVIDSKNFL